MPTTINDELLRIEGAKSAIATAIGGKGVTVPANAKIDDFADLIDAIQTGGGGSGDTLLKLMNKTITSFDIPSGVTSIPQHFFNGCGNLQTINIPTSITSTGTQCFRDCAFTSLDLRHLEHLTTIGAQSFYTCRTLEEIYLPSSITSIGQQSFFGCQSLTKFVILNANINNMPSLGLNSFQQSPIASGTGYIYVPYSSDHSILNAYKNASNWSAYANQIYELDANGNIPT